MKIALILVSVILCISALYLFLETINLQNNLIAQIKSISEEYISRVSSEREQIALEFQEKYKSDMEKFAQTVEKLKKEKEKAKALEESRQKKSEEKRSRLRKK